TPFYGGDVALRQESPRHEIRGVSRLDSRRETTQLGERPVHRDPLIEGEIGSREPHDRGPLRRDCRAGYDRIAGPLEQPLEDIVEVVALKSGRLQFEPEPRADSVHELDVEACRGAVAHELERR